MDKPPKEKTERIMDIKTLSNLLFVGLVMGVLGLLVYLVTLYEGGWRFGQFLDFNNPLYLSATASVYATLVLCQVANAFSCRSPQFSVFKIGFWANPWLLYAELVSFLMLWGIMDYPPLQNIFRTNSPTPLSWGLIILSFLIFLVLSELRKKLIKIKTQKAT